MKTRILPVAFLAAVGLCFAQDWTPIGSSSTVNNDGSVTTTSSRSYTTSSSTGWQPTSSSSVVNADGSVTTTTRSYSTGSTGGNYATGGTTYGGSTRVISQYGVHSHADGVVDAGHFHSSGPADSTSPATLAKICRWPNWCLGKTCKSLRLPSLRRPTFPLRPLRSQAPCAAVAETGARTGAEPSPFQTGSPQDPVFLFAFPAPDRRDMLRA